VKTRRHSAPRGRKRGYEGNRHLRSVDPVTPRRIKDALPLRATLADQIAVKRRLAAIVAADV